ncbi:T9SS type B sorting domain-containing protein [Flavobacterium sp. MK4S-17]|uniref:T9SS type B sorting domain-containing protein n=1 Tax=Flavobacterium sp. MK4S-17 TaxID=2543737 RepID=UPI00135704B2|nr:T9SS type B sorting domain-containing protein [Flavobacterium sp. MK4S-17]
MKIKFTIIILFIIIKSYGGCDILFSSISSDTLNIYLHKRGFFQDCESHILLSSPEFNKNFIYRANNIIETFGSYKISLNGGANITMKAGFTVVLKPGTTILRDNSYLAAIEECRPSCSNSFTADKFFSPNGDNNNDFWNIHEVSNMSDIEIYIFDRYGKLLINFIYNKHKGWDGTYNGQKLPATDYWYVLRYKDCYGKLSEFSSHFSLLR